MSDQQLSDEEVKRRVKYLRKQTDDEREVNRRRWLQRSESWKRYTLTQFAYAYPVAVAHLTRKEVREYETLCRSRHEEQAARAAEEARNPIDRVNDAKSVTNRLYRMLKSGRDKYSNLSIDKLRSLVSEKAAAYVADNLDDESQQATALRWHLRGLIVERAVGKVKHDIRLGKSIYKAIKS